MDCQYFDMRSIGCEIRLLYPTNRMLTHVLYCCTDMSRSFMMLASFDAAMF